MELAIIRGVACDAQGSSLALYAFLKHAVEVACAERRNVRVSCFHTDLFISAKYYTSPVTRA